MLETIEWTPQGVVMIDQTLLPTQTVFVTCTDYLEVANAIKTMIIRGAPAIGVAAAMGVAIGVQKSADPDADFATICDTLQRRSMRVPLQASQGKPPMQSSQRWLLQRLLAR